MDQEIKANSRASCYEIPSERIPLAFRNQPKARYWGWYLMALTLAPWGVLYVIYELVMHWLGIPHPHIGR